MVQKSYKNLSKIESYKNGKYLKILVEKMKAPTKKSKQDISSNKKKYDKIIWLFVVWDINEKYCIYKKSGQNVWFIRRSFLDKGIEKGAKWEF